MISLTTDKPMCYSGNEAPCAYGELLSIGSIGGDKNKMVSNLAQSLSTAPAAAVEADICDHHNA
jgi:phenylpyruvate tautomerase